MLTPESKTLEILRGRYDPDTDTGYMGHVPASEFITGEQLIDQLNFHNGVNQNSECGWLKFYVGPRAQCNITGLRKVFYISKQPLKHSVSWDHINSAGLVYGDTDIDIKGQQYSVRLITGGGGGWGKNSEWDESMCRVHPGTQPKNKHCWDTFDPALDTTSTSGNGRYAWCQETPPSMPSNRVLRGGDSLVYWRAFTCSTSNSLTGWRPVLELVE